MRIRKQLITNLYLKDKDIKKLANGYVVYKRANKHAHALIPTRNKENMNEQKKMELLKARMAYHQRQMAKIAERLPTTASGMLGKRRYTKKNTEFWAKGGNVSHMLNRLNSDDKSTLRVEP